MSNIPTLIRKYAKPKKTDVARSGEAFPKPVTHAKLHEGPPTKKSGYLNIR